MLKGPKKTVSLTLPLELYEKLRLLAQDSGRTLPRCLQQILERYVHHLENVETDPEDWWRLD